MRLNHLYHELMMLISCNPEFEQKGLQCTIWSILKLTISVTQRSYLQMMAERYFTFVRVHSHGLAMVILMHTSLRQMGF